MSESPRCALCRTTEDPRPNRIGGIDLCRRCHDGGAVAAAHARGFQLRVKCGFVGHGDKRVYVAQGDASVARPLFDASFRRKGLASLVGLLGMTIRVEDPLFHKLGVIITRDKPGTHRFIDDDGAQTAVMDLLGEDVSVKVKRAGQVKLSGRRKHEPFDQTAIERELAVLLVHLDGYAAS
ncbi:hypothetical protein ENSA5_38180 [Enhygromyxa salina]|uniref:Uncharacterized protein n=1 Tax=Enhygromyxa salina TaxID=215803 RepID=A0A2S9XRP7_9BACT|nr:hypothetical protein [Enhygromyxa salina]PRP95535.1 hypothetical protein ENSA5_38180 [Enhygromyxa salina]